MPRRFYTWKAKKITNIYKETDMKNRGKLWKYFLVLLLAFALLLPASAESETELEIPDLEPEATYEIQGQDLMTLYQTINDLNETKNEWKNLTNETFQTLEDAVKLAKEYEKENKKLQLQNNFLVGGITISVGVVVAGAILFTFTNIK